MFSIAERLQKQENVRVIAFDGSETWLYSASRIPVFNISEKDILRQDRNSTEEIERYSLENWNLVKLALAKEKDILFRLKTRKPSKRGFFCRTVINFLDAQQRAEKARNPNHECTTAIAYFLEEAQNAFSSRNTSSTETEEFLTVFNEARNNREGFFTSSQRLTDFSKTIRSKQIQCIGKLSTEDITPNLRRIEKAQGLDFSNMKSRTWYYEGATFESPEFKQQGKPYIINSEIKQLWLDSLPKPKVLTLKDKIKAWFNPQQIGQPTTKEGITQEFFEQEEQEREERDRENEEEDLDAISEEWIK